MTTSSTADPLHMPGGSGTYWTTINAEENLPGVVTPLSSSFWLRPVSVGTLGAFADLGVLSEEETAFSERVDARVCSVFYGRFAANVDLLRSCADRTPGTSGEALEQQLFSHAREGVPSQNSARRYPIVAVRAPRAAAGVAGRIHRLFPRSQAWWSRSVADAPHDDEAGARARLADAHEHMAQAMRPHTLATFMTSGVFERLTALAGSVGRPDLVLEISRGLGKLEETDMLADLWDVSRDRRDIGEFLSVYGFHGPGEASASASVWRENPESLRGLMSSYRAMSERRSPRAVARDVALRREVATQDLMELLPRAQRVLARRMLAISDAWWPLRETGKATLLHSIDVGRAASRRLGALFTESGVLAAPDDVAYLTVDELVAGPGGDWSDRVERRREQREKYLTLELPQTWEGTPEPAAIASGPAGQTALYECIGGSPGAAEGRVRIVHDPIDTDFEDGEVLVCETTDPSWSSLFLVASALIIDVGGAMSHGAIVARELGVPCVINTRTGSRTLRDGDRVRVDGSAGRVEVLERAGVATSTTS